MRAGKLRSKINLLRLVKEQDEAGGMKGVWKPYAKNVRCDDRIISSRDNLRGQLELNDEVHTILIRYRNDIEPEDRVELSDGRTLKIEGRPRRGQKRKEMIITAVYDGK